MKTVLTIAVIPVLVLFFSLMVVANAVLAQDNGCSHNRKGFWSNLTAEQREAVEAKMKEMRNQNASPEETHAAITEMLKGYGIDVPGDWKGPHGPGGFFKDLTEEQREAVEAKMKETRNQNSSPEETHTAIAEMLKGYGIDVPGDWKGPHGPGGFFKDLTEEQREAVKAKMKDMRSQNAKPEEIHSAVAEMLKGYGIEVPKDWPGLPDRGDFGPGPRGFLKDLTKEQRDAVHDKIKEMRSQNAKPEEIHSAVAEMLKGYGIEIPEKGWGHFGFGRMGGSWGVNLTDEQREAVRDKMEEMRSQGAKREEIRSAIDKMIQSFGNNPPENSENLSSVTATGENGIIAQSYPNPFNPQTHIAYTLNTAENVRIQIYNVTGQLIRTFDMGYQPAGSYSVLWNGRNEQGGSTASGVYLYRIEAGPYTLTNRMVLLK